MTLLVPQVIILESFLSFLGLGIQEPMTSWGVLISVGAKNIGTANWLLLFPAFFLVSTLFALNFVGDGLRDALDPRIAKMETPETILSVKDLRVRFRTLDGTVEAVKASTSTSMRARPLPWLASPVPARARP